MNNFTDNTLPQTLTSLDSFAPRILTWFEQSGRHDLPWQQHLLDTVNPYPVWLSEVMLQQTQVATVIPYFERFITSFPTVQDLANADWQQVAEHWAGLGYYARARNLHKGAKQLAKIIENTGDFPKTVADWETIAGVGRSTAGAIVAMGVRSPQEKGVICDGNVKRVLTRWAGIDGDINKIATTKQLWELATHLTPENNSGHYAQAMMDMGATLCTKAKPACLLCPVQSDCIAHAEGRETFYPVKSKKSPNPSKFSLALQIDNSQGETLWLQRPDNGIWGGLWCLPLAFVKKEKGGKIVENWQEDNVFEAEYTTAEQIILEFLQAEKLLDLTKVDASQDSIKHSLTHFHWYLKSMTIHITKAQYEALQKKLTQADMIVTWANFSESKKLAKPKAMEKILVLTQSH